MNEPQAFAQTDAEWLASINRARDWFQGPLGSLMLAEERRLLCDELTRYFGGYLVHYGPHAELPPSTGQIQRGVRLGRRCRAWTSPAKRAPGRSANMPRTWSCCNTAWISACRLTVSCAKPRVPFVRAATCC